MDYQAHYRKISPGATAEDLQAYYDALYAAMPRDPQATARTRDADGTIPGEAREVMFNIAGEIQNRFHELGAPIPPLLEGCVVLDLCCGAGRDTYLLAQLVGESGRVVGVEPSADRLKIAEKYLEREIKQFGYAESNVTFIQGCPEDLSQLADATFDVVISNCTFNLSPDKGRYIREVKRVLKPAGEWYFTDIYTDRRIPDAQANDVACVAQRLAGACFIEDFRRLAQESGFYDPRFLMTWKSPLSRKEQAAYEGIAFATITSRLINSELTSDYCEDYGEEVTYDGSLPDYPEYFLYDRNIRIAANAPRHVCDNISVLAIEPCRYAKVLKVEGNRSVHHGSIRKDDIIGCAPDFDGVIDEDDRPLRVSCC